MTFYSWVEDTDSGDEQPEETREHPCGFCQTGELESLPFLPGRRCDRCGHVEIT